MNFDVMENMFSIMFTVVAVIIAITGFRMYREWSYTNKQPLLTVDAYVVSKRHHTTSHTHNQDGHMHHNTDTSYFVTFEVESGDRIEMRIQGTEFGQLAEGDWGRLTFQGNRFHRFERRAKSRLPSEHASL
ncbi:hypothetical protein B1222_22145 [Paenibacillus larvae subsp. pulvifaciens]|uniref:DUF2500 domain-containing protein n=1 Tax=Paenibacillus larvae TaxID=1464 RepID=UPI0009C2E8F6|nr:DUF2500 domain-containing protein [Paenibacillus larvae]AQT86484.1 hypothetical protein B1222_22145 [Paenibacillus larvae subsp. pulvifaciens]